jgi:hypothetical protein
MNSGSAETDEEEKSATVLFFVFEKKESGG